jgi:nicotinamidase/pyrazinamidase
MTVAGSGRGPHRRALVIVDVQNDFTEGGAAAVAGGDDVARRIGAYLASGRDGYALVATTQDWHIDPGPEHFTKYPPHCVAGSEGAELDPGLSEGAGRDVLGLVDVQVKKGQYSADFSGFKGVDAEGRPLADILSEHSVGSVDVCGLALNACVAATLRDALDLGLGARLLSDLSEATSADAARSAEEELAAKGALVLTSSEARSGHDVA